MSESESQELTESQDLPEPQDLDESQNVSETPDGASTTTSPTPWMIAATIDCHDLEASANFWSELFDMKIAGIEEPFAFLSPAEGRKVSIWLQKVPEDKVGKNRVHLDFAAHDLEAVERRVVELGGSLGERQSWHDFKWRVCRDPEGNEFDVMQAQKA